MKVTVIPIVIGTLRTVTKVLALGLEDFEKRGRVEIIRQEYEEESSRLDETCCHSDPSRKPSANTGVKNSQKSKKTKQNKNQQQKTKQTTDNNKFVDFGEIIDDPAAQMINSKHSLSLLSCYFINQSFFFKEKKRNQYSLIWY